MMKKVIVTLLSATLCMSLMAQRSSEENVKPNNERDNDFVGAYVARYKMYPTQNMWIFLKLDTQTGRIWLVQYSVGKDTDRLETVLNDKFLTTHHIIDGKIVRNEENGRFALYPTQNMYSFILLDRIEGDVWQVQWSTKPANRGIIKIDSTN